MEGGVLVDKQMVKELVDGFLEILNEKLVSVILYGSVARGTASGESDIDVALLIKGSLSSDVEDK
ncbi:MAG: nucleotidyltransferase domain-containing protein, partial [Phascolarctobacterium sp.]|nr:nucleotidyltransferase domain-containing protein [Phascolarctobacterium sp.]